MAHKKPSIKGLLTKTFIPQPHTTRCVNSQQYTPITSSSLSFELADISFLLEEQQLRKLNPMLFAAQARLDCYKAIEQEADEKRIEYLAVHYELRKTPFDLQTLLVPFAQSLSRVHELERRLIREFNNYMSTRNRLGTIMKEHAHYDCPPLVLDRVHEAHFVLEHIRTIHIISQTNN